MTMPIVVTEGAVAARRVRNAAPAAPAEPVNDLDPARWREYDEGPLALEFGTIWSFPDRDASETHKGDYRGNFAPQIARQCLLRFTRRGETVLDCFLGSGTTLIEAKMLGRRGLGVELNPAIADLARSRIARAGTEGQLTLFGLPPPESLHGADLATLGAFCEQEVRTGDARDLTFLADASVDCVVTHPPYHDIIEYSDGLEGDLSLCRSYADFLAGMRRAYDEMRRVLKPGRHLCLLAGDAWHKKQLVPIGLDLFQLGREAGRVPIAIIVKEQHNISGKRGIMGIWKWRSIKWNMFLFRHEYLLVFRKPAVRERG